MPKRGKGKSSEYAKGYPVNYKRRGGPRPLPDEPPRPPTSYDTEGINLHCTTCGDIFNGPDTGKNIPNVGPEYRAVPNVSDRVVCGKKSCIDKNIDEVMVTMRQRSPEKDLDRFEVGLREHAYKMAEDRDEYPKGFVDDTPPPGPPIDDGFGDE